MKESENGQRPDREGECAPKEIRQAALHATRLDVSKDIAHASQGSNQRLSVLAIHLRTQATHVNIDHVRLWLDVHTPHPFENHGARDNPTGIATKKFKQRKFLRRQPKRFPDRLTSR